MAVRTWTEEALKQACIKSTTLSQVLRRLGLRPTGGNYDHIKRVIAKSGINTSHFTGKSWASGKMLKSWECFKKPSNIKKHLLTERGNVCQCCGLSEWMDSPITLELHHNDGNRTNNHPENLTLLCPNCHSLTDNWRGKKLRTEVAK